MEKTCNKIEKWIRAKAGEAGAKGAVIGMSGGLDSSVAAVLAKRALGNRLTGLVLPCDSCPGDARRANIVAKEFKIITKKVSLTMTFNSFKKILPSSDKKTLGNLKARLRMAVLYYFANRRGYLVIGTSNKSELMTGYFTKHGDSAADILPLGDLYKTEVAELAEHLGIPETVLKSPPAAGLWKGQTDEKEIGMDYEKLDSVLKAVESGKTGNVDRKALKRVRELIAKSEHKRRTPGVCKL